MSDWATALRVLLVCAALVGLAWLLFAIVRGVRRGGGKGVQALGAAMMMFGWGHMRDPRNDTVAEARDGRVRRDEYSGDPLDPDCR
jgi:hypothetical protein